MTAARRYAPEIPFAPYSYVTGMWPHPLRDPAGHSFGMTHPPVILPDQAEWHSCRAYCYAVDLWNAGYYWEAHEHWEALWHAAGRTGPTADFFKGLIKLAAAGVKAREGRSKGVTRHLLRAQELFQQVRQARESSPTECFWGMSWSMLLDLPNRLAQEIIPAVKKLPVQRVWKESLLLST